MAKGNQVPGGTRGPKRVLEAGTIIQVQKKEPPASAVCNNFNVYLNGKGPDGKILHNINKVILPTVENEQKDPMDMKLVFDGCKDAAEIGGRRELCRKNHHSDSGKNREMDRGK